MFISRYMPCSECGASVERAAADSHTCDPERRVDYQMFTMRREIAGFEQDLQAYLEAPRGLFDTWLAAQEVRRSA